MALVVTTCMVLLWARSLSVAAAGTGGNAHDTQCCDCISAGPAGTPPTEVRFAQAYGDEMVLQQGTPAHVWGYAAPGSTVSVTLTSSGRGSPAEDAMIAQHVAMAGEDGTWRAFLAAQPPTTDYTPHTLVATGGGSTARLTGIVFGDVWLCSGQSNMDHPMTSIVNASAEIAAANAHSDSVRLLKVKHTCATVDHIVEFDDLQGLETRWSRATNVTVSNFSATCWLTGSMLQRHLGYPVGLIDSSWAGVAITPLMSEASCSRCGIDATIGCDTGHPPEPQNATSVYNTMIAPLHSTTIFGVLWWQGEASGAGCPAQRKSTEATYYCLWQSMIQDWRARWHAGSNSSAALPFGFVQLEPTANPAIRWAEVAQRIDTPNDCLPGVFMAVAMDFGDTVGGVHTRYKKPIAARLALAARAVAYGETSLEYAGPHPFSAKPSEDGKSLSLQFSRVGAAGDGMLELRNLTTIDFSICSVKHAAICYQWANDEYFHNTTISLGPTAGELLLSVPEAVLSEGGAGLVRYAWTADPCNWPALEACNVYSKSGGLPVPPFMLYVDGVAKPSGKATWPPTTTPRCV